MILSKVCSWSLLIAVTASPLMGAEVDQFTNRDKVISDSAPLINLKANKAIQSAIANTNNLTSGCNEEVLYKELQKYYANHMKGELVKDILTDARLEKRVIPLKQSVYQDWNAWDGVGMGFKLLSKTAITMSGVIRVGEQEVGTDKFEHMFGQGFQYFKKNYLKNKGEVKAVERGIFGEKFLLGGNKIGNGVFSYGDLSANFNGMRMWNHMLQKYDDVLGADRNLGPYIACENDRFTQVKKIDFRNYLDSSMDESINCSKFPSEKTANKFKARLRLMGMSCPTDISKRDDMVVKYRQMSKWIINTDGNEKVKYTGEFKGK